MAKKCDTYTGPMKNAKPHGKGKLVYADKRTDKGTFVDGQRGGTGTLTWSSGDQYSGYIDIYYKYMCIDKYDMRSEC